MNTIPLADVKVEDRIRIELGDIEGLANSIKTLGLLHPIVIDDQNRLIAGGRRYTAFKLLAQSDSKFNEIPFTRFGAMPIHQKVLLEVEENVRRVDMSWQERVLGIAKYHDLAKRAAILDGDKWTQAETGDLFGVSQGHISSVLTLADELRKNPEGAVAKADSSVEAIRVMIISKQNEAAQERLKRLQERAKSLASQTTLAIPQVTASDKVSITLPSAGAPTSMVEVNAARPAEQVEHLSIPTKEAIASLFVEGDCLDVLPRIAANAKIHHIVCDPPYGILMESVSNRGNEGNVDSTHTIEGNLDLLPKFLKVAFDVLDEAGFLVMWYDLDHHEKLIKWGSEVGFRVTRWPLVWCKTSMCVNTVAQYNITKATEVCMFMRKSEKSVLKQKKSQNWLTAPALSNINHPFVKPRILWDYIFDCVASQGQTVVDPFCGCGSSLAPALQRGLSPIGIEIDKVHIANGIDFVSDQLASYKALSSVPSFLL